MISRMCRTQLLEYGVEAVQAAEAVSGEISIKNVQNPDWRALRSGRSRLSDTNCSRARSKHGMNRRQFLGSSCLGGASALAACASAASGGHEAAPSDEARGVLVDTTECVGCRKCEWACNKEHHLTEAPLEAYEDTSVFDRQRRMDDTAYTVVNRFENKRNAEQPVYVKYQCMHCVQPACVSACLVGALRRETQGAVTYDAWKCIGCRYCMVACPFEVPAYEYANALTPAVRKCSFCFERTIQEGESPACVAMCPPMALTYGKRSDLIALAHEKIAMHPDRYVDHVYGEHETGGTSWLYLAGQPLTELGMPALGDAPVQVLAETIQHSVFKFGLPPLMLLGVLGIFMKTLHDGPVKAAGEGDADA